MRKKDPGLIWIPLFVDKWIYGSTRDELDAGECATWIDFLCLAAKDSGFIRANVGFPYTETRLAGLLGRPIELIHSTIEKCLRVWTADPDEKPKLTRLEDGTLYVTNWEEYQFTDRYRRMMKRKEPHHNQGISGKSEEVFRNPETIVKNSIVKDSKEEKSVIDAIVKAWNEFAHRKEIPWIQGIAAGSAREKHLKARIAEGFDLPKILEAIDCQSFLTGDNPSGWLVTFDWILNPTNLQKILEGNYTKIRRGDAARRAPDDPRIGGRR